MSARWPPASTGSTRPCPRSSKTHSWAWNSRFQPDRPSDGRPHLTYVGGADQRLSAPVPLLRYATASISEKAWKTLAPCRPAPLNAQECSIESCASDGLGTSWDELSSTPGLYDAHRFAGLFPAMSCRHRDLSVHCDISDPPTWRFI